VPIATLPLIRASMVSVYIELKLHFYFNITFHRKMSSIINIEQY
ncbi:GAF domain protein, partial [Vibrio parahaemolyticus EKP-028]